MRAVWVDAQNDPRFDLFARHNITWAYVALSDPPADVARRLNDIKSRGFQAGVYSAWSWFPGTSGAQFAEAVHQQIKALPITATATYPRVQLNDETHDPGRIMEMLKRWRELRPYTATSWTLEGMQGGWAIHPPLVKTCVDLQIRVVPQSYDGAMNPWDTDAIVRDLTRDGRAYPTRLVTPFHDAATLRPFWSGWAFTQGRLK